MLREITRPTSNVRKNSIPTNVTCDPAGITTMPGFAISMNRAVDTLNPLEIVDPSASVTGITRFRSGRPIAAPTSGDVWTNPVKPVSIIASRVMLDFLPMSKKVRRAFPWES